MNFLENAKKILVEENATCVIINENEKIISLKRGIVPVLEQLKAKSNALLNASVADKVVGKSAAFLFVYGNVKNIYAKVISDHAIELLDRYHIPYEYEKKVPYIINRKGDGMCPMEKSVVDIHEPDIAFLILCEKQNCIKKGEKK